MYTRAPGVFCNICNAIFTTQRYYKLLKTNIHLTKSGDKNNKLDPKGVTKSLWKD